MSKGAQLRQEAQAKQKAADGILKAGEGMVGEEFDAEMEKAKGLIAERDALLAQAKTFEELESSLAQASQPANRIVVGAPNFEKDPKFGFKDHTDFLLSVIRAGKSGRVDDRLRKLAAGSDEAGTFDDSAGGFLVPDSLILEPKALAWEGDPTVGRTTRIPMNTTSVKINARVDKDHSSSVTGGLRVYRRQEADTVAGSAMKFEQIHLATDELMGVAYATNELLNASPVSFAALIAQGFQTEFGSKIIDEKIWGNGVGKYLGVMTSPCLITVAKEDAQAADTITYVNLAKMRGRAWGGNQVWLYNADCLVQLLQLIDASGRLIWASSAREGEPDMLMGRPAFECEACAAIGDLGDIILGSWGEYLEGQFQGVNSESSIHVRFLENETAFRVYVSNAGAPWWRTALTPKHGNTRSPFVTLAAR